MVDKPALYQLRLGLPAQKGRQTVAGCQQHKEDLHFMQDNQVQKQSCSDTGKLVLQW